MSNEARQLWRIYRLRQSAGSAASNRPGGYLNSPLKEDWMECGTVEAPDEDTAAARARTIVGNIALAIRVEAVDEFYKPESLQN